MCGKFQWEAPGFEWFSPIVFLSHYKTESLQFINDPVQIQVTEVRTKQVFDECQL